MTTRQWARRLPAALVVAAAAALALAAPATATPDVPQDMLQPTTVRLSASPSAAVVPGGSALLTATTNGPVDGTIYAIRIFGYANNNGGQYQLLASCSTGSSCSYSTTQQYSNALRYFAFVEPINGGRRLAQTYLDVTWANPAVALTAQPPTVPIHQTSTVTATATVDVTGQPFAILIFDGPTWLAVCTTGTTCSATVSQDVASTHQYVAYVGDPAATVPPAIFEAKSNPSYVTWSDTGWQVSVSAPAEALDPFTVTATANKDVLQSPYYLEIFEITTGTRVAICGEGTTCSGTFSPSGGSGNFSFVAYVSPSTDSPPTTNVQANSTTAVTYYANER